MKQYSEYTVSVIGANNEQNDVLVATKKEALRIAKSAVKAGALDVTVLAQPTDRKLYSVMIFDFQAVR